jgi:hypothetical protein
MLQRTIDRRLQSQEERIGTVFGLSDGVPLPAVDAESLRTYHRYLRTHLAFPFQALYVEERPPIRHFVRYIMVSGLLELAGRPLEGIVCKVEGIAAVGTLMLVELGVRGDDPNYQMIDDYAYWFLNWR